MGGACLHRIMIGCLSVLLLASDSGALEVSISGAKHQPVELKNSAQALPSPRIKVVPAIDRNSRQVGQKPSAKPGDFMALNFESAPIREVIKNICELAGLNYIIEPGVSGFVTIRTLNRIPASNALDLLDQLLTINNLARVKIGDYWRFLPASKALGEPLPVYRDMPPNRFAAQDRYQIQILTFNYVSAGKVVEVLKPFLSKNASVKLLPRANMVLLVERGTKLQEIVTLVKAIDVDSLDTMQVKLFELENSYAQDVTAELESIYKAMGYAQDSPGNSIRFLPLDRLNAILMVNPFPNLYPSIKSWIDKLDAPPADTAEVATFIYQVQNGDAISLASILRQIYLEKGNQKSPPKRTAGEPVDDKKKLEAELDIAEAPIEGELRIIPHADTNAIVIRTAKINYQRILETLKKLDVMPLQVLIEVLITELSLTDELRFGLEWALRKENGYLAQNFGGLGSGGTVSTNLGNASFNPVGQSGISFFTRPTKDVMGLMHALARDSKLDVEASPIIMTSDNKLASIDIADEVPIPITTTTINGVTRDSIQYRSVGIRLSVTPKINEDRYVSLEIDQEISQVSTSIASPLSNAVPLFRRQAKTTVVVKDQQTLVIGGMIREDKSNTDEGVPFLYKIPILGWLFGTKAKSTRKTELLILLTPHVISSEKEAEFITEEYRAQIRNLQAGVKATRTRKNSAAPKEKTLFN